MMCHLRRYVSIFFLFSGAFFLVNCAAKKTANDQTSAIEAEVPETVVEQVPQPAAYAPSEYLNLLQGKKVGLLVNHTSQVDTTHLIDYLLANGVEITRIFAPEHGFRGTADAGEKVSDEVDAKTGISVVSLYGKNKKPSQQQLEDIEVFVYDIQDVGCRFYTYISSMYLAMDACAEAGIPFVVLDRPNPNGDYIDGPVLDMKFKSFVGMLPIPVVYGMTAGELALMINGEGWLSAERKVSLEVVTCKDYDHQSVYKLPIKPSPNLPNYLSVRWYPSLCFFEGTHVSAGRGTDAPFQQVGAPDYKGVFEDRFTPMPNDGSKYPKYKGQECFGVNFSEKEQFPDEGKPFTLSWLLSFYEQSSDKERFFNDFFKLLAGTDLLRKQIEEGLSEEEIRISWASELENFKVKRQKYLLYKDGR